MNRSAYPLTTVVALSLVGAFQPFSSDAAGLRTVALTGQHAPGTTSGVTYESFGSFLANEFLYQSVVLNDAGQTAFRSNLSGSGVDSTNNQGVWSEGSGNLALVARAGSQAPGAPAGVNFRTDPAAELYSPVLNNAGQTAFFGALTDGGLGLWSEGSGNLAPVARNGQHAPGTSSGVNFNFASLYEFLAAPILNDRGQTAFRSYLSGSGVNSGNNFGLWSEGSGNMVLLARLGSPLVGIPGVNYNYMFEAGLNDAGQTTFFSLLSGSGVNSSNDKSIWSEGSGSMAMIARTGNPAPGMLSGTNFSQVGNNVAINNAGQTVFVAGLTSDNSPVDQDSIWLEDSGNLTLLALRGTHAPGTPAGVMYDFFGGWPALNDAGQSAFGALLTGDGVDTTNDKALFLSDALGNVTLVRRMGDQAPGTPLGTVFGPTSIYNAQVLNNAGQIAIMGSLTGPGVGPTNNRGIWASDRTGVMQLIARTGDQLGVAAGDFRTISEISFVGGNGTSNGWPSGFNNVGQVAFWASFTDGSQGLFVSNTVAGLLGDFNFDGIVDAADYTVWRNGLGSLYTQSHYSIWRAHFGQTTGSGASLPSAELLSAVPEPGTLFLMAAAATTLATKRRFATRRVPKYLY